MGSIDISRHSIDFLLTAFQGSYVLKLNQLTKSRSSPRSCALDAVFVWKSKQPCHWFFITLIPRRCPFEAIAIINLPTNLESQVTHRYTANAFKLHRLPTPRPGQVLGLVGTNGIGKSTALKILAGKLKPNLGRYDVSLHWYCLILSLAELNHCM